MQSRNRYVAAAAVLLGAGVLAVVVHAGTVTSGPITLTYPSYPLNGPALQACEPWDEPTANTVSLAGIPEGSTVTVTFTWGNPYFGTPNFMPALTYNNVTGGSLVVPVSYPPDSTQWPLWDQNTNERAIAVGVAVRVTNGASLWKIVGKQWWIRCLPPKAPFQGCTPGYWRQDHHFDSWVPTGYAPGDDFETVFGVNASFDPHTLLDAVWLGGGHERALARHAVAALLNSANPDVNYAYTTAQIIAGVQNAYATGEFEAFKTDLDFANNAGCPVN